MEAKAKDRSCAWLTALGVAKDAVGDVTGARDALHLALIADRVDLAPAEALFDLARKAARSDWIDEALREIRARAMEQHAHSRAYLAAALLVARGVHHEEDRLTYEALRVGFRTRPRAPIAKIWLTKWLEEAPKDDHAEKERVALGDPIPIEGPLKDALDTAQRAFGFERLEVRRLVGEGRYGATLDPTPAIAIADGVLETRFLKGLRFDLARAVTALVDPRLLSALRLPDLGDGPEGLVPFVHLLDRAGLLLSGDAAIALETVGAKTARGKALTAFCASRAPVDLWAEIGLGVAKVGAED
jgi:hypothetical protein